MSEINIDADLVNQQSPLSRVDEKLVEMTNGCICCTLRDDLLQEVSRLAREKRFDYLLIESTGDLGAASRGADLYLRGRDRALAGEVSRLDTMVTVVDAKGFLADYQSRDSLRRRKLALGEEDTRTLSNLLNEQVELADVILLNKADLVSESEMGVLHDDLIRKLNPRAEVHPDREWPDRPGAHPEHPGDSIWLRRGTVRAGWRRCATSIRPRPRSMGYPASCTGRACRFTPLRFAMTIDHGLEGVLRSKGFVWIASRPNESYTFSISPVVPPPWKTPVRGLPATAIARTCCASSPT